MKKIAISKKSKIRSFFLTFNYELIQLSQRHICYCKVSGHSILFRITLLITIHINLHDVLMETITLFSIILSFFNKLISYNKVQEYIKFFCIRWCQIFMKSDKFFACKSIRTLEIFLTQITIVGGMLPAQHARNTVRAQCSTYASHFVTGTYVGGICLALFNRHLFIYIKYY